MKKWQKYLLIFFVLFSFIHLIRDVLQDNAVKNILSTTLVKNNPSEFSFSYWAFFNGYLMFGFSALTGVICLIRKRFGTLGYLSIGTVFLFWLAWVFYWLYL